MLQLGKHEEADIESAEALRLLEEFEHATRMEMGKPVTSQVVEFNDVQVEKGGLRKRKKTHKKERKKRRKGVLLTTTTTKICVLGFVQVTAQCLLL